MSEKSNLHDEEAFEKAVEKGGPFDVGPNELDDDIGRRVRFPEAGPIQRTTLSTTTST